MCDAVSVTTVAECRLCLLQKCVFVLESWAGRPCNEPLIQSCRRSRTLQS